MSFRTLGLSEPLLQTIQKIGYLSPTPIQEKSIPEILMGKDLLACAQTGTGKTASFALPLVDILQNSRKRNRLPRAIILTPTRELAAQVEENIIQYAANTSLNTVLLVGGEIITSQERKLKKGVDIIIATPGRFIDMLERGRIILIDIKIVVIDEADRMLDMGFMPDMDCILEMLPKLRQTLLLSATLGQEIKQISGKYQVNPKQITVTHLSKTADTIDQYVVYVERMNKRKVMRKVLIEHSNNQPTIVFCNRKKDVDIVAGSLRKHGYAVQAFHGDLSQHTRNEALDSFKKGESLVLVTSDVAARGIDILGVTLVINFDMPINNEDYVHRIGRTGRAGKAGKAITFVAKSEKQKLKRLEHLIKKTISPLVIEDEEVKIIEKKSAPKVKPTYVLKEGEPSVVGSPLVGFGDFIPAFMLTSFSVIPCAQNKEENSESSRIKDD